jgi:hypothetical protein
MQTNDENNDIENGLLAVEEDGNEDTVCLFNIPTKGRITGGQMKSIWRGHQYPE